MITKQWAIVEHEGHTHVFEAGSEVASLNPDNPDTPYNAQLIVTAPELLAFALKAVTAAMEGRKLSKAEHAEGRAAIAKAGGAA